MQGVAYGTIPEVPFARLISMDFTFSGGWHVTLFHPWTWLGIFLSAAILVGVVLKLLFAWLRRKEKVL